MKFNVIKFKYFYPTKRDQDTHLKDPGPHPSPTR